MRDDRGVIEIRTPVADDVDAMFRRDEDAFGGAFSEAKRAIWRNLLPLDRFRVAHDGSELVGIAGSFEMELTLPGDAVVPMAGTTWVSVAPTHRRQGLLRRLIEEVHADVDERGDPIAGLQASEAGIYERFGYGAATRSRVVEIDRRRVQFDERFIPDSGGLRSIEPLDEIDRLAEIYDRYRRQRVGEVSRTPEWMRMELTFDSGRIAGVVHADGYAVWKITQDWNDFDARHELRLLEFVACTDEAHTALWNLVLSYDLVGPVLADQVLAPDDRLPAMLTNPRVVKTKALHDFLWVCPRRLGELLASRRYRVDDSVVVDVDGERWRVDGGPGGAVAAVSTDEPDYTLERGAFGALLLGGVSATALAAARRLSGADLPRADVFFGWEPGAHCTTSF